MNIVAVIAIIVGSAAGLLSGLSSGAINIAESDVRFRRVTRWDSLEDQEMIDISLAIGAILGALLAYFIVDRIGRQAAISYGTLVATIGGTVLATASQLPAIYVGRGIFGVALGLLWVASPIYLAEIASSDIRGALIALPVLLAGASLLAMALVGRKLTTMHDTIVIGWRIPFIVLTVCACLLLIISVALLTPTPRWLAWRERNDEAERVLSRLRGKRPGIPELRNELRPILLTASQEHGIQSHERWYAIFLTRQFRHALFILALRQLCGQAPLARHSAVVLRRVGFPEDDVELIAATSVGATMSLFVPLCMLLVDQVGRRWLLTVGATVMAAAQAGLAMLVAYQSTEAQRSLFAYITLIVICLYLAAFSASWGPVAWVYVAEVFPLRHRATGVAIASIGYWTADAIIAVLTPYLIGAIDWGIFVLFGSICLLMAGWSWVALEKTERRSLESISRHYTPVHTFRTRTSTATQSVVQV